VCGLCLLTGGGQPWQWQTPERVLQRVSESEWTSCSLRCCPCVLMYMKRRAGLHNGLARWPTNKLLLSVLSLCAHVQEDMRAALTVAHTGDSRWVSEVATESLRPDLASAK
jgi:hypothetical protein